ncbi:hypothetical protein AOQ84DRAFT_304275 [Glonium stellatum]|uniref:Uncharacterized protein n=1 Tax=Glonium stellatum TaxID=574774 RepID=A0A8E2EPT2_9PEZI|nr:hypothetical protein AOQ84DRAFT_304275 [Glonium stellatum]
MEHPTIASAETHTMGNSLFEYIRIKVHPEIQERDWNHIVVRGYHVRTEGTCLFAIEKKDKPFNWQRPTITNISEGTLQINCFPGEDYVQHYAAIIATYLALHNKNYDAVRYLLPTTAECMEPLITSNLRGMGPIDIAIIGYVDRLNSYTGAGSWEGGGDNELFAWQTMTTDKGIKVGFLGCRICFWGDIGGNVIRALQQMNQVKCVIYIGKLGSLRPGHAPNQLLASGSSSFLRGELVEWQNPLETVLHSNATTGVHYSLPSVLEESRAWLEEAKLKADWVDPEIGYMAKTSLEGSTQFGYLHIVSDNLMEKYQYDLSNERLDSVLSDRENLFKKIETILAEFFLQWGHV